MNFCYIHAVEHWSGEPTFNTTMNFPHTSARLIFWNAYRK